MPDPASSPLVSIVVPLYNEAENVQAMANEIVIALSRQSRPFEVLLVDDGSSDPTWECIVRASQLDPRVRGVRHARNAGQSAAVWTGLQAARGEYLGTLDGDLQNDPAEFPQMLDKLEGVDMVCGMRSRRQDNWLRKVSSAVARSARALVLRSSFRDTGCALRVFRKKVLHAALPFNGMHRFLPILVAGCGYRVIEVSVNHRPRQAGVSKYGVWNRAFRGLIDLFGVAWFQRRRVQPEVSQQTP
jgi:dolichol-phosphate mannosyltransferase